MRVVVSFTLNDTLKKLLLHIHFIFSFDYPQCALSSQGFPVGSNIPSICPVQGYRGIEPLRGINDFQVGLHTYPVYRVYGLPRLYFNSYTFERSYLSFTKFLFRTGLEPVTPAVKDQRFPLKLSEHIFTLYIYYTIFF